MKASEIADKIQFHKRTIGDERTIFTASVQLERHGFATNKMLHDMANAECQIKQRLKEELLRDIYDDQRQELYIALVDLLSSHPFDFEVITKMRTRLLNAAMRQQPMEKQNDTDTKH